MRIKHELMGLPRPTVMFHVDELRGLGYQPEDLGMISIARMATEATPGQLAELPTLAVMADMKSRYDIDLYEMAAADMNNPTMIIGGVFEDPHADDWWNDVHIGKSLIVAAGDTAALTTNTATLQQIWMDSYIGVVPALMVRAYDTGVGTAMPDA